MTIQRQALIWFGAIIALIACLWLFEHILLPFIVGFAAAYFLDPLADRLEKLGLSRLAATALITLVLILVLVALALLVLPVLYNQCLALVEALPGLIHDFRNMLLDMTHGRLAKVLGQRSSDVQKAMTEATGGLLNWAVSLAGSLWSQGLALVSIASLVVIAPVIAFYMLLDWDRMVAQINRLLPRDHADTVRQLALEMNMVLAGFVRGQGTLCLFLGTFYAGGLSLVGLRFGLIIGLLAGILSFIPYLGTISGLVAAVVIAIFQFPGDYVQISLVAGVFGVGNFIEGNFLAPKLVGDKVGLHPVWIMFALFAFGDLFGFVGLLLAMPMAAVMGVLVRYSIHRYLESRLYLGTGANTDDIKETGDV